MKGIVTCGHAAAIVVFVFACAGLAVTSAIDAKLFSWWLEGPGYFLIVAGLTTTVTSWVVGLLYGMRRA